MASSSTWVAGAVFWARELVDAGYGVLGIDISEAMIELARRRAPEAEFRVGSLFEVGIPPCAAVTAISEVLNYLFDPENEERGLGRVFRRVYDALARAASSSSTCLVPGRCRPVPRRRVSGWGRTGRCSPSGRRMPSGARWSGGSSVSGRWGSTTGGIDEVHRVRLYDPSELAAELERAGFLATDDAFLRRPPARRGPHGVRRAQAGKESEDSRNGYN